MSQANKRAGEQSVGGAPMSVRNGSAAPRRPFSGVICGVTGRWRRRSSAASRAHCSQCDSRSAYGPRTACSFE